MHCTAQGGLNQVSHPRESLRGTCHAPLVGAAYLTAMQIDEVTKEGEVVEGMRETWDLWLYVPFERHSLFSLT